jgi:hypothetical protein
VPVPVPLPVPDLRTEDFHSFIDSGAGHRCFRGLLSDPFSGTGTGTGTNDPPQRQSVSGSTAVAAVSGGHETSTRERRERHQVLFLAPRAKPAPRHLTSILIRRPRRAFQARFFGRVRSSCGRDPRRGTLSPP